MSSHRVSQIMESHRLGLITEEERDALLAESGFGATLYASPVDVFEHFRSPSVRLRPQPVVENLQPETRESIIAEWRNGRSSTEIAHLLNLPEQHVTSVLRREILEHPKLTRVEVQGSPKEENKKPETITRLKALKREIGEPEK